MGRFWLLLTSLSPALMIASIRTFPSCQWGAAAGFFVGVLMVPATLLLLRKRGEISSDPMIPLGVHDESDQIPAYLITFVFPFLFITESPSQATLVAYSLFAVFLLILLYRADLAVVNPALLMFGFHVYAVEAKTGSIYLISRRRPVVGVPVNVCRVSGDLYVPEASIKGTGLEDC